MRRLIKTTLRHTFNNPFLNTLLVACRVDSWYANFHHQWKSRRYNPTKSLQENVGLSHREDVEEAIRRVHDRLLSVAQSTLAPNDRVLDIGSGTGLVAKKMALRYRVTGVDISEELTAVARRENPDVEFHVGDFMTVDVGRDYAMIYSIGMLMYIPPGQLSPFFSRVHDLLRPGGIFFLQYTHALRWLDLWYPNISYIKYSPHKIERCARRFFLIDEHHHSFWPEKTVRFYDRDPFPKDSFVNGYLLVARKV